MGKLLIVDDHADIRRLIRMTLEIAGHGEDIIEADDGVKALELARRHRPDVVLTDVMMPGGVTGLTLCHEIKDDPALAGTAVVMLSARGMSADRQAGLDAGASIYLVKPFSPLELIGTLKSLGVAA